MKFIRTSDAKRIYDITPWQMRQWVADGRLVLNNRIWCRRTDIEALCGHGPVERVPKIKFPSNPKPHRESISDHAMALLWDVPVTKIRQWKASGTIAGPHGRVWADMEKPRGRMGSYVKANRKRGKSMLSPSSYRGSAGMRVYHPAPMTGEEFR